MTLIYEHHKIMNYIWISTWLFLQITDVVLFCQSLCKRLLSLTLYVHQSYIITETWLEYFNIDLKCLLPIVIVIDLTFFNRCSPELLNLIFNKNTRCTYHSYRVIKNVYYGFIQLNIVVDLRITILKHI